MSTVATIVDIAKKANVGVSTVSRVLNDHPDVSPKTREKVLRIAGLLNYRPHSRARQLVRDTTETICFIMSNRDVVSPFHSHVLVGVEQYARSLSRNVIFMRFDYQPDIPAEKLVLPQVIWERGTVDGIIIAGMNYPNFIKAVKKLNIPFVLFGNNLIGRMGFTGIDSVWFDNEGGTWQATDYLIKLRHEDIWFVADLSLPWYRRCYEGYAKAMRQYGLTPRELDVTGHLTPFDQGFNSAEQILNLQRRISAIVAGDDEIALGIISRLRQHSLRVPEDLSVVGFDDIQEIKYFQPPLTTIRVPKEQVGEELAKLLFERLANPGLAPVKRMMPTELVIRESCVGPRAKRSVA